MQISGIDVSVYQGNIDWAKVKASGQKFAIIRLGWCGYDGLITKGLDEKFKQNIDGAIAAGIDVGIYVYSYAKTEAAAIVAANEVKRLTDGYKLAYPVMWDFEDSTLYAPFGKQANVNICKAFLERAQELGYYAMLYTYTYFASSNLDMSQLSAYDLWIADYRGYVGYTGAYGIWQYSSSGSVDGISGRVDMNISYKDYPSIIKAAGLNGFEKTSTTEPLSDTPCQLKIGYASSGDVTTLVSVVNNTNVEIVEVLDGYITTDFATAAQQIPIIDYCTKLAVPIVIYKSSSGCECEYLKEEIERLTSELEIAQTALDAKDEEIVRLGGELNHYKEVINDIDQKIEEVQ